MGAAVSTSVAKVTQSAVNQTYQRAQNSCTADCNQTISGNVIVLDGSTAGDVNFTQRCEADASCYMSNALDQLVQTFQAAKAEAGASPALYPGIQINTSVATTDTDIRNEMTQIMENICKGKVDQNITENVVYATDSTLGNIGFVQEGNAYARCVMENSGRLQLQMRQEGDATAKSGGAVSNIAAIIALVIILLVLFVIIRAVLKKTKPQDEGQDPNKMPEGQDRNAIPGKSTVSRGTSSGKSSRKSGSSSQASSLARQVFGGKSKK